MPLSNAVPRKHSHHRQVECRGYEREDGLWDIEGHLTDTKPYSFENRERGLVEAGTPVHDMWIRLTIDNKMCIMGAEAATDYSPYQICGRVTPDFGQLVGLSIGPGWSRKVAAKMGGVLGCTHLVELLRPLATTAFQTVSRERSKPASEYEKQPRYLNGCHALAVDGPIVEREWPQFYKGR
jgi:hypothetical protein